MDINLVLMELVAAAKDVMKLIEVLSLLVNQKPELLETLSCTRVKISRLR